MCPAGTSITSRTTGCPGSGNGDGVGDAARQQAYAAPPFGPRGGAARAADRVRRDRLAEAETWLVRGAILGGESAPLRSAPADRARVDVRWAVLMGMRHRAALVWTDPVRGAAEPTPPNTALAHAEVAYRAALRAAAELAVHGTAADLPAAESARTRQRVRALRRHCIPRLRDELAALELALEESEHEEAVRRRWAATRGGG
ncbi:V-type ATPase, D subunit [Streptomyces griseofuscus]|nr:V-type ATPase, D subunit [Streptomyces griseofuscus]